MFALALAVGEKYIGTYFYVRRKNKIKFQLNCNVEMLGLIELMLYVHIMFTVIVLIPSIQNKMLANCD